MNISKEANLILEDIRMYGPIRPVDLVIKSKISKKNLFKHLSKLLQEELIKKNGYNRNTFYSINNKIENITINTFNKDDLIIEYNYMYVTPSGQIIRGINRFQTWCNQNQCDLKKESKLLSKRLKEVNKIKKHGLISAKKIILLDKKELYMDNIFFSDFYNIDHFGKTKLGHLV